MSEWGPERGQVGTDWAGEGAAREPTAGERRTPDAELAPGPRHLPSAWQLSLGWSGRGGGVGGATPGVGVADQARGRGEAESGRGDAEDGRGRPGAGGDRPGVGVVKPWAWAGRARAQAGGRGGSHVASAHMTGGAMDPLPTAPGAAAAEAEADEEADPPAADSPVPPVSEPRALDAGRMQVPPGNPLLLSLTLQELLARDAVQVELVPEKKGLFLKHVEYEVSSQRFKSCVYRRYNDFVVFHETLLHKFPYRMVPALPPKRMLGADREFIEARRRALKRFINLVARHPPFSEDVILKLFLSFSGPDVQNKLKESAQCVGDEFMNCKLAARAKDFLPADIQTQFAMSRELIRNIYNSFHKLRDRAERMVSRAIDNAADLLIFGKELSALGSDTTPLPSWASLNSGTWGSLKQALKGLSVEFALLADKAAQQGKQEENDVVEKLNLFLDLLQSYKDLCERHEKGVLHKHQRALHKYSLMKRQMMSATAQSREPESVEQLESRIVEQENVIQTMELRNYFSLYCLHQETQLVHVYLPLTSHILGAFVNSQIQGHKEMSKVWNDLQPKLRCLFVGPPGAPAPPRPPQDGLSAH